MASNVNEIWEAGQRANPHALYERMRRETPVCQITGPETGMKMWFLTRHADCLAVLRSSTIGKQPRKARRVDKPASSTEVSADARRRAVLSPLERHMLALDPPDHTRLRALIESDFSAESVGAMRPTIEAAADALLREIEQGGRTFDLARQFATLLPLYVIGGLMGIPHADMHDLKRWSDEGIIAASPERVAQSSATFRDYCVKLFVERRANPKNDLVSRMLQTQEAGASVDEAELVGTIYLMVVAGHETVASAVSNAMLALFEHPDAARQLRSNPSLIPGAVEEALRWDGPIEAVFRWTYEDLTLEGQDIQRGALILPVLLAANRDPALFPRADEFVVDRRPNRHITFGHGIHYCLGARLARLECEVALAKLLSRFPKLESLKARSEIPWLQQQHDRLVLHGPLSMPVSVDG